MTGKRAKGRTDPDGMDADRIRKIMGEAPARPRKGHGTSGNDITHPARRSGPIQPSVYREEYLHGIAGMQRRSLHIPAALYRKLPILAGASRNGKVMLEDFINHLVSRHLEEYREVAEMILKESLPSRLQRPVPMRGASPVGALSFVSGTIVFSI